MPKNNDNDKDNKRQDQVADYMRRMSTEDSQETNQPAADDSLVSALKDLDPTTSPTEELPALKVHPKTGRPIKDKSKPRRIKQATADIPTTTENLTVDIGSTSPVVPQEIKPVRLAEEPIEILTDEEKLRATELFKKSNEIIVKIEAKKIAIDAQVAKLYKLYQKKEGIKAAENRALDNQLKTAPFDRITEWESEVKRIKAEYKELKKGLLDILNELDRIHKESEKPLEISGAELKLVTEYFNKELLRDDLSIVKKNQVKLVESILSGEADKTPAAEKQAALQYMLVALKQHYEVAKTLKDQSSTDKENWGIRYEKLKALESLFLPNLDVRPIKIGKIIPQIVEEAVKTPETKKEIKTEPIIEPVTQPEVKATPEIKVVDETPNSSLVAEKVIELDAADLEKVKTEAEVAEATFTPDQTSKPEPTVQAESIPENTKSEDFLTIDAEEAASIPALKKKSFFERAKEKLGLVANKEVGKVAAEVAYKTVTSILGIKTATDIFGAIAGAVSEQAGFGDINKRRLSAREIKIEKSGLKEVLENISEGSENIQEKIAELKAKIEASTHIAAKEKESLLKNLLKVAAEYQKEEEKNTKTRDKQMQDLLDLYLKNKVSGMTLAKDALNTALTASGLLMVRGVVYATLSVGERAQKASREHRVNQVNQEAGQTNPESKLKHLLKDLTINAAVETARSLAFMGAKKEAKGITRATDFLKAAGTIARGFGIYGLALSDSMSPDEAIESLMSKIKEQGIACAVKDNFLTTAEKTLNLFANPTSVLGSETSAVENSSMTPILEAQPVLPAMAMQEQFAEQLGLEPSALNQVDTGTTSELLRLAGDDPDKVHSIAEAIRNGRTAEEIYEAWIVHKGDGLERMLQRQLKLNPASWGFQGDLSDAEAVQKWAGREAHLIAKAQGIDDKYFVFHDDKPQYLILNSDRSVSVVEGRLFQDVERPVPEGIAGEAVETSGDEVVEVSELVDLKGQPIFLTKAERLAMEALERSGHTEAATELFEKAKKAGEVYALPDGTQIHKNEIGSLFDEEGKLIYGDKNAAIETNDTDSSLTLEGIIKEAREVREAVERSANETTVDVPEATKELTFEEIVNEAAEVREEMEGSAAQAEVGSGGHLFNGYEEARALDDAEDKKIANMKTGFRDRSAGVELPSDEKIAHSLDDFKATFKTLHDDRVPYGERMAKTKEFLKDIQPDQVTTINGVAVVENGEVKLNGVNYSLKGEEVRFRIPGSKIDGLVDNAEKANLLGERYYAVNTDTKEANEAVKEIDQKLNTLNQAII
jgi:hypothetical protein